MRRWGVRGGLVVGILAVVAAYYVVRARPTVLTLTGIVTTDDVIVSAQVPGQIGRLLVAQGQTVTAGQSVAEIAPDELRADRTYYTELAAGATASVAENVAALRYEEQQQAASVKQARASLSAAEAQRASADADLENARLTLDRTRRLHQSGLASAEQLDQARTAHDATGARVQALAEQADAARAAVALAEANAQQVAVRRSQLQASRAQSAAAAAEQQKAGVRAAYTDVRAPIAGIVDVRAARQGEVVAAGQPIVTLINPDDLWVRVDVEESYIDRVRLGDRLAVTLPSGAPLEGTVFYRGVDAGFATQRDVSRTKRDIKTFEIRLRVPDPDHRLAVGLTAYVQLPVAR